jgi:hypothetical protein
MYRLLAICFALSLTADISYSQSPARVTGTGFFDYVHHFDSRVDSLRGHGGFTYRRLYLTADFAPASNVAARLRVNSDQGTLDARGPAVYMKDAWVRWTYAGDHRVWFGAMPPPMFQTGEGFWGYRSLERTLPDLARVAFSRDLGLRLDGPLTQDGTLRYGLMMGNNSDVRPSMTRYKRFYSELTASLTPTLNASLAANYVAHPDDRNRSTMVNGAVGYVRGGTRIGGEWYAQHIAFDVGGEVGYGLSAWAATSVATHTAIVGRYYLVSPASIAEVPITHTFIAGVAFSPNPSIRIIPNLHASVRDGESHQEIRGRLTVEVNM